jgi:hypothetical protein
MQSEKRRRARKSPVLDHPKEKDRMAQQKSNGRPTLSEKGLLTPENCVVALIDHQPQMLFGVSNFDRQGIINNVIALAKATRVFDIPVVLSTVETKSRGLLWRREPVIA